MGEQLPGSSPNGVLPPEESGVKLVVQPLNTTRPTAAEGMSDQIPEVLCSKFWAWMDHMCLCHILFQVCRHCGGPPITPMMLQPWWESSRHAAIINPSIQWVEILVGHRYLFQAEASQLPSDIEEHGLRSAVRRALQPDVEAVDGLPIFAVTVCDQSVSAGV